MSTDDSRQLEALLQRKKELVHKWSEVDKKRRDIEPAPRGKGRGFPRRNGPPTPNDRQHPGGRGRGGFGFDEPSPRRPQNAEPEEKRRRLLSTTVRRPETETKPEPEKPTDAEMKDETPKNDDKPTEARENDSQNGKQATENAESTGDKEKDEIDQMMDEMSNQQARPAEIKPNEEIVGTKRKLSSISTEKEKPKATPLNETDRKRGARMFGFMSKTLDKAKSEVESRKEIETKRREMEEQVARQEVEMRKNAREEKRRMEDRKRAAVVLEQQQLERKELITDLQIQRLRTKQKFASYSKFIATNTPVRLYWLPKEMNAASEKALADSVSAEQARLDAVLSVMDQKINDIKDLMVRAAEDFKAGGEGQVSVEPKKVKSLVVVRRAGDKAAEDDEMASHHSEEGTKQKDHEMETGELEGQTKDGEEENNGEDKKEDSRSMSDHEDGAVSTSLHPESPPKKDDGEEAPAER
eukprot:TRINITY_DN14840_c0_g1::TRINITY_DN14840_c0_g1_i1::g.16227::m.16227 TRINITY_DN14840_c0_g1::TRINITY_DN14840_c0_g1_i1::g.16227  ORF type:complete len:469 (-),score=77.86,Pinin_SDK_memA/PF04696.8/2.6e+03,Pinin_SDK_memA/PF04696.8/1.5e+04,Pinin_SDK_memA/PF04696.8/2.1e+03,Pinin_SDK_memA/PF04696.8/4e-14,Pinin_SDK_memA/PF04696.8/4.4e+03 TRINITY_DN14840_c0_g1_i1:16-1422(-)